MAKDIVKEIRRATRRKFNAEEKIRIVLEGLRGEVPVSDLCRREGIAPTLYYRWSILRHASIRSGVYPALVGFDGQTGVPGCAYSFHHSRCGRKQWIPLPRMEA